MERYNRLVGSNVHKNDVIEIRGIKIDKTARRVWVNGDETTFTTKEFDLLTFLAENPNRVFTKEELFREIWDMESVGDIATVTVHIKKIREIHSILRQSGVWDTGLRCEKISDYRYDEDKEGEYRLRIVPLYYYMNALMFG